MCGDRGGQPGAQPGRDGLEAEQLQRQHGDQRAERELQTILDAFQASWAEHWEEIYADWPADSLQYYWRDLELEVKAYDSSYHEERDRQAFAMAEQGDKTAVATLHRIVARDKDPAKRQRAEALLATLEQ